MFLDRLCGPEFAIFATIISTVFFRISIESESNLVAFAEQLDNMVVMLNVT